jgi:hypothetical protein
MKVEMASHDEIEITTWNMLFQSSCQTSAGSSEEVVFSAKVVFMFLEK